MASEKSTNKNHLALGGFGNNITLDDASLAFELDPRGIAMVKDITSGCVQIGPKGTDPERCMILVSGSTDNPEEWWLIDYRETISDDELEARKSALTSKIAARSRSHISVRSTQDIGYRLVALR